MSWKTEFIATTCFVILACVFTMAARNMGIRWGSVLFGIIGGYVCMVLATWMIWLAAPWFDKPSRARSGHS